MKGYRPSAFCLESENDSFEVGYNSVREAFTRQAEWTTLDLARAFGATSPKNNHDTSKVLIKLASLGEIERIGPGKYRLVN